jgi:competence protein ComEC
MTGFSASGIRAATMGSIFIFSGALGRQNTSSRTIVLAAALMLLQNPLLLTYDIGFQLSFMASMGIIYFKPLVSGFLRILFKEKLTEISDIISVTISAQVFTLPLMVYDFGVMPLVAPITSILILPVLPWILSFGFMFSILGIFSKFLGWIFYIPCWILITYFLKIVDLFSQPWMARTITNISWIWILVCYFIIGFIVWFFNKRYSQNFL